MLEIKLLLSIDDKEMTWATGAETEGKKHNTERVLMLSHSFPGQIYPPAL